MATAKKSAGKKAATSGSAGKKPGSSAPEKATGTAKAKSSVKSAPGKKSTGRKYGPLASQEVAEELHEMKLGKLTIGKSGEKVTNPKQAIAIGLAKARREGGKVPPNPNTGR